MSALRPAWLLLAAVALLALFGALALPATAQAQTTTTLSRLTVTAGGTDLVTFESGTTDYTASVANDVAEVTVTAMTTDSGASIEYLDGSDMTLDDADTAADGHQVTLAEGDNVIKVKVTAADTTTKTYTVTVTRAEAASACTLNTGDLWCGVVTVGTSSNGVGFVAAETETETDVGALTDNNGDQTITIESDTYTISSVLILTSGAVGALVITLDTKFPTGDVATLEFDIGSKTFKVSEANELLVGQGYFWLDSGLTWSDGGPNVTLRLRRAATPPDAPTEFTAKVGDAQVALAWDAPGPDSGVTGYEYRYKTTGDYLENWTAIANSAVGGANEASHTVTELTNEEAHTFELRAVNTAGGGDAAEAGPVTPTPGICDRTQQVHENIVFHLAAVDDCAAVTVADLAGLTSLDMASWEIASLKSGDFAGLTSLTFLGLGSNSFTTLPADVFSGLTALTTLVLASGELTLLPAGVFSDLTNLTRLYLDNNALESLPDGVFSGLTALTTLDLNEGKLTTLPEGVFSGLTALEDIDLNENKLTTLPEGLFSGLTALTRLYLYDNDLDSLPEDLFSDLTALEELTLGDNALESLPDGVFSGLTALTRLFLGGNSTNPMELTVTVEKVGTDQVRAKVLAGAPFAVDIPVTLVNGDAHGQRDEAQCGDRRGVQRAGHHDPHGRDDGGGDSGCRPDDPADAAHGSHGLHLQKGDREPAGDHPAGRDGDGRGRAAGQTGAADADALLSLDRHHDGGGGQRKTWIRGEFVWIIQHRRRVQLPALLPTSQT